MDTLDTAISFMMHRRAFLPAAVLLLSASFSTTVNAAEEGECTTVLRYFDIRGRAEAIRLAMRDWDVPFVDATFSGDEWGKERADGLKATWSAEGKLAYGQVPLLEIDRQRQASRAT